MILSDKTTFELLLRNLNFRCVVTENLKWPKNVGKAEALDTFFGVKYEPIRTNN